MGYQSRSTAASLTVTAPSGVTATDKVLIGIAVATTQNNTPTWTPPTNFALLDSEIEDVGAYRVHIALFENTAAVNGVGSYTVGYAGNTTASIGTQAVRIDGVGARTDAKVAPGQGSNTYNMPAATVAVNGSYALAMLAASGSASIATGPSGYTQRAAESVDWYVYDGTFNTPNTGTPAWTLTATNLGTSFLVTYEPVAGVPGVPQSLSATPGNGQVGLSWSAPASDGGSAITSYKVEYRDRRAAGSWTTHSNPTGTTATVTGLTNYDRYEFRVSATNAVGTGSTTALVYGTPTDGNDPTDTFNYADGDLDTVSGGAWVESTNTDESMLRVQNDYAYGITDSGGTVAIWGTEVGANQDVQIDSEIGGNYSEITIFLGLDANDADPIFDGSYLLQRVTDGDVSIYGGTINGPAYQIWRSDGDGTYTLLDEAVADTNPEVMRATLIDGVLTLYADGVEVCSAADTTWTGHYVGIANTLTGAGTLGKIDNFRVSSPASTAVRNVKLGDLTVDKMYLGDLPVTAAYLGDVEVHGG
jgi:Fibronectin type III domain